MLKYFSSFRGKITLTLLTFALLFVGTILYVFIKNAKIFQLHNSLIKHSERNVREVFVFHYGHQQSLLALNNAFIQMDTTGEKRSFDKGVWTTNETLKEIQAHCDSLGLPGFRENKKVNDSLQNVYISNGTKLMNMIGEMAQLPDSVQRIQEAKIRDYLNNTVKPSFWSYSGTIWDVFTQVNPLREKSLTELEQNTKQIKVVLTSLVLITLVTFLTIGLTLSKGITVTIEKITSQLNQIARGKIVREKVDDKNEVGMIINASNAVAENLDKASDFAIGVGQGNFELSFTPASNEDQLGHALMGMRDELQKFKKEDVRRLWINEGFNQFGELLRKYNNNIQELSDRSISFLVKYMSASQGSLYLLHENVDADSTLKMIGCYAYNRKKHIESEIALDQGLIGQAFQERDYIYLTEVPSTYIKITSGLGEATPTVILIMPLVIEGKAMGVLELASFTALEPYRIEFLKKISQDMASVLLTVQTNEHTQQLVTQLQSSSEQMHGQEEELRQNMEELVATQEEMKRKEQEYLQTIDRLQTELSQLHKA